MQFSVYVACNQYFACKVIVSLIYCIFFFCITDGRICFVVVARYEPAAKIGEKILDNVLEPIKITRKTAGI